MKSGGPTKNRGRCEGLCVEGNLTFSPSTHCLQIIIILIQHSVVDVPVFNINNTGDGGVMRIVIGAFNYVPLYTGIRNNRARAAVSAIFAINRLRDIYVASHVINTNSYLRMLCAELRKITVVLSRGYLASFTSIR